MIVQRIMICISNSFWNGKYDRPAVNHQPSLERQLHRNRRSRRKLASRGVFFFGGKSYRRRWGLFPGRDIKQATTFQLIPRPIRMSFWEFPASVTTEHPPNGERQSGKDWSHSIPVKSS